MIKQVFAESKLWIHPGLQQPKIDYLFFLDPFTRTFTL